MHFNKGSKVAISRIRESKVAIMKKFRYSLETVMQYKEQILDRLKEEYAARMLLVQNKRDEIEKLKRDRESYEDEFQEVKRQGSSIERIMIYVTVIERMGERIEEEKKNLLKLEQSAEEKKAEVIEANIDYNKFEKLKERKLEQYHFEEQKEQENFIEEFVSFADRVNASA